MRIPPLAVIGLIAFCGAAQADASIPIHVLSTGLASAGARVLGIDYMKAHGTAWENGPDQVLMSAPAGQIQKAIADGKPADVVILPTEDMDALDKSGALMPGSNKKLGRVDFGVAVPADAPRPDISTYAKFVAALVNARAVAHTDPKLGSAGGVLIGEFLKRPEFAGIKKIVLSGNGATSVARGDADIAIETMGTLLPTYGVVSAGLVPASLNAHLYFSIGVMAKAPAPEEALAFEKYAMAPAAAKIWKRWGVER